MPSLFIHVVHPWPKSNLQSTPSAILEITIVTVSALLIGSLALWHYQPYIKRIPMTQTLSEAIIGWCTSEESVSTELAKNPLLSPGKAAEKLFGHELPALNEKQGHGESQQHRTPVSEDELEKARQCGRFGNTKPSELFLRIFHDALLPLEQDPLVGMVSPNLMGSTGVVPLTIIGPLPDVCRHMSNMIARAEHEVFLATNYWIKSDATRLITDALRELSKRMQANGKKAVVKILYDRGAIRQIIQNHYLVPEHEYADEDSQVALPHPDEVPGLEMQVMNYHRPALGTFHSKFMVVDRKYGIISSNNIQDNDNLEMASCLEGPIVDSLYETCLLSWHEAMIPPMPCLNLPARLSASNTFDDSSFQALFVKEGSSQTRDRSDDHSTNDAICDGQDERQSLHAPGDPHYDDTMAAEVKRMRSVLTPRNPGITHSSLVTEHLNRATHQSTAGAAPDPEPGNEMVTYIPLVAHKPVPMALVNRKPWGAPNHSCTWTPQNEAWISALRNAKRSVFAQTPDLNAQPLVPEIIAAVKRGIEVTYYVCLGYNDDGELLPGQGGHNEKVAARIYADLNPEERKRLHVGYYVGKDQVKPIHNKFKKRSCHIKLMIVDEEVAIQGNGNLDTQSFYHSQETNVMIDSAEICAKWLEGLRRNQNTHLYGMASQEDGVWRDADGHEPDGAIGKTTPRFAWAQGFIGAVNRVRGVGGF